MTNAGVYLPGQEARASWMRTETTQILKRFFFCERALLTSEAAWLPRIGPIDIKTKLPRFVWQSSQTADALRERIFELRYPSRLLTVEADEALVDLIGQVRNAPSALAFLLAIGTVLVPAFETAYRDYLSLSDPIADGPTRRFLALAVAEKREQAEAMAASIDDVQAAVPANEGAAQTWVTAWADRFRALGGIGIEPARNGERCDAVPGSVPYTIPDQPARDHRFFACRFYWPDTIDPSFPYGEGVTLQLRSAVSHLNEAWAVETAGAILYAFADVLPWDWIREAARWTYDEARHCRMGYERLRAWGFDPAEVPLGTYIYESAAGQDPIYRLGMLFFFETKNIGHKTQRARLFREYGDAVSEHDMDLDWADETIHAGYGKHWLQEILTRRGGDPTDYQAIRDRCGELVQRQVASATTREREEIGRVAKALIAEASRHGGRRSE